MRKIIAVCITILVLFTFIGGACSRTPAASREGSQRLAEEFARLESTFRFDGIKETFMVTSTTSVADGWRFTIEFKSRYPGYGNRSGQILAGLETHHIAVVTVQNGKVTKAIMDEVWDMVTQRIVDDVEIALAPIHEVDVVMMQSNPPQVGVLIKGGLSDGCTGFHNIEITREGDTFNIKVTTKRPKDVSCPAIYTNFEKDINLGSDFTVGTTYTLNINDYTTTFTY